MRRCDGTCDTCLCEIWESGELQEMSETEQKGTYTVSIENGPKCWSQTYTNMTYTEVRQDLDKLQAEHPTYQIGWIREG